METRKPMGSLPKSSLHVLNTFCHLVGKQQLMDKRTSRLPRVSPLYIRHHFSFGNPTFGTPPNFNYLLIVWSPFTVNAIIKFQTQELWWGYSQTTARKRVNMFQGLLAIWVIPPLQPNSSCINRKKGEHSCDSGPLIGRLGYVLYFPHLYLRVTLVR